MRIVIAAGGLRKCRIRSQTSSNIDETTTRIGSTYLRPQRANLCCPCCSRTLCCLCCCCCRHRICWNPCSRWSQSLSQRRVRHSSSMPEAHVIARRVVGSRAHKDCQNQKEDVHLPLVLLLLFAPKPPKPVLWVLLLEPKPPKPPPKDMLRSMRQVRA